MDNHTSVNFTGRQLAQQLAELEAAHTALLAQSAEQEARIAQLSAELTEANRVLDRVASEAPFATIARLEERVAELTQEKTELLALARDTAIAPVSRIVGIVAKEAGHAYRPLGNLSRDGPSPEPVAQRIHVGSLEVEAGIGRGTFSRYIREVADRGHVGYIVQPDYAREGQGKLRSAAFLLPGTAVSTFVVSTRKQKAKDRAAEEKAKTLARAEKHAAKVAELETALARAQADGCPHCGGDLLPTGYFCPSCREDHATEELARIGGSFHRRPPPVTFTDNIYTNKPVNFTPRGSPEESTGYGPDGDQPFWGSG
jgi:cell division septum initiation protein DivIVA